MKHVRIYEDYNKPNEPEVGDYCVIKQEPNSVGKLISKQQHGAYRNKPVFAFIVDIPGANYGNYVVSRKKILFFSRSEEDCKMYIQTKKYNL